VTDIALRPATADDAEFLFVLHERLFRTYVDLIWGWDDDAQRAYMAGTFDPNRVSVLGVNDRAHQLYRRLDFTEVSRDGVAPEVRIRMVVEPGRDADLPRAHRSSSPVAFW
jgi:hypothetical protein